MEENLFDKNNEFIKKLEHLYGEAFLKDIEEFIIWLTHNYPNRLDDLKKLVTQCKSSEFMTAEVFNLELLRLLFKTIKYQDE